MGSGHPHNMATFWFEDHRVEVLVIPRGEWDEHPARFDDEWRAYGEDAADFVLAARVVERGQTNIVEAFRELAEASGGRWDEIEDVAAYVDELRGKERTDSSTDTPPGP